MTGGNRVDRGRAGIGVVRGLAAFGSEATKADAGHRLDARL